MVNVNENIRFLRKKKVGHKKNFLKRLVLKDHWLEPMKRVDLIQGLTTYLKCVKCFKFH